MRNDFVAVGLAWILVRVATLLLCFFHDPYQSICFMVKNPHFYVVYYNQKTFPDFQSLICFREIG